jgi:RNA polymerase sigma factor (sigma-70 family)
VGRTKREKPTPTPIEPWELELLRATAQRFRTPDREELEAELSRKLLQVKSQLLSSIRNWKAYLRTVLRNTAINFVRDRSAREEIAIGEPGGQTTEEPLAAGAVLSSIEIDPDLQIAIAEVWKELDPELRLLWELLVQEEGNQLAVAKRLGKHRNTIRLWIRKILRLLERHGIAREGIN